MTSSILISKSLTKRFGALYAVQNLDFQVKENEIFGIIGPNGAGKTTVLSMINGILPITKGELFYRDRKLNRLKPYKIAELGISSTFQIVKPFPGMTVLENVCIGAMYGKKKIRRLKEAKSVAFEILEKLKMDDMAKFPVESLTVSSRKRLEFARALAMDPDVLLLDEVMAGLNQSEIEFAMELIQNVNKEGKTILVIEHVMKAIMGISHRILVIHHGEKIAEGTPNEISSDERVISAYLGEKYAKKRSGNING